MEKEKKPLTSHAIKNYLTNKGKLDAYLLEYFENYIERLAKSGNEESKNVQHYKRTKKHLENFFEQKKWKDILIDTS